MIYYSLHRKVHGPVTVPELHHLYASGSISDRTLVMRAGARKWTPYHVEFRASAPPRPLLPLPPSMAEGPGAFSHSAAFPLSPRRPGRNLLLAGWILLACTVGLGFIPLFGFASWFLAGTVAFITIVLAVIALSQGASLRHGITLLIGTLFLFPVVVFLVPLISTLTVSAMANAVSRDNPQKSLPAPRIEPIFSPASAPAFGAPAFTSTPVTRRSTASAPPRAETGIPVHLPDATWVVHTVSASDTLPGSRTSGYAHRYLTVRFSVTNTRREPAPVVETPQLIDSEGHRFSQMPATDFYLPKGASSITLKTIPAGATRTFSAIYEVPRTAHSFAFEARALSLLPDRATIRLGL